METIPPGEWIFPSRRLTPGGILAYSLGMEPNVCYHYFFSGRVQGVGFRATCQREARDLGLVGWVRNTRDGRVEALIQGPVLAIQNLENVLHNQIDWICIDSIEKTKINLDPKMKEFQVIR